MQLEGNQDNLHNNPLKDDLDQILIHTEGLWEEFRDQRIFITGGTGFFGCWLLESFIWANHKLNLNASAVVLTRDPETFERKVPHLYNHKAINFLKGDIQDFVFPKGAFPYLIHSSGYKQTANDEVRKVFMVKEMLNGTTQVLDFCVKAKVRKMLLVSTGAVYGHPPPRLRKIPEHFSNSIDPTYSKGTYHHVRRMMEALSIAYAEENKFEVKIARCFSFIGPYLSLDGRFAASDFIHDALCQKTITVKGDGKTVRSYLYMADLMVWLWTILFRGQSGRPYNVGSERPIAIHKFAEMLASQSVPPLPVTIQKQSFYGTAPDHYVPDTTRAREEMNLRQHIMLLAAIKKTMNWYRKIYSIKEI